VSTLAGLSERILNEFGLDVTIPIRIEYEDNDFNEYITPKCFEEIPNCARIRLVTLTDKK